MVVTKIEVSDMIMIGNLFIESGYDKDKSADNLADLKGKIIFEYLVGTYPDVEICVDIAIQSEAGPPRPLEVAVYTGNENLPAESAALQEYLSKQIAEEMADYSWAVKTE